MKRSTQPYTVILAGGSGTRFWPLSRELYPKQLLPLLGEQTMLQRSLLCARTVTGDERIMVVTHQDQTDPVRQQAGSVVHLESGQILSEPRARNTAAAIGLAAITIFQKDPGAVMVVMPADHVITKRAAFSRAIRQAGRLAEDGWLVTLGIKPNQPETGYGYIRRGKATPGKPPGYRVSRFTEKPDLKTARRYVSSGGYYWNSGIFIWKAGEIIKAIRKHQPDIFRGLEKIRETLNTREAQETLKAVYSGLKTVSIDYGVLEKVRENLAVIPVEMGWSDVGSWPAIHQLSRSDRKGNVTVGNVVSVENRESLVYAGSRLVAALGLEGMAVIDTEDATLVCPLDRAQEVRKVVDQLKRSKAEERKVHRTVVRPWGTYTVLENGPGYKIKRILVNPRSRLSLQLHKQRSEHWVVVEGRACVRRGDEVFELEVNQSTYIPMRTKHRLENTTKKPLQIIEVQNGPYLGEDDIIRYDDDYGRRKNKTSTRKNRPGRKHG
ncbi:MAG TPA: mannose-1-phosphate guanylyltransferase/mannose-6-phosphate isomerase [Nitrospiria bacterium]